MAINPISGSINVSDSGDDSVKVISKLGDRPTQDDGLTAAEFKGKFDTAAVIIGNFVNTIKTTVNQIITIVNRLNFTTGTAGFLKTTSAGAVSAGTIGINDIPTITNAKLGDGVVDADKLATDAVETAKIKNNAVTNSKMASNAVVTRVIQDGAVTAVKLGDDVTKVYVVTTAPTSSSADGVYLVVSS